MQDPVLDDVRVQSTKQVTILDQMGLELDLESRNWIGTKKREPM